MRRLSATLVVLVCTSAAYHYGGYDGPRRTSEIWALRANAWERLAP